MLHTQHKSHIYVKYSQIQSTCERYINPFEKYNWKLVSYLQCKCTCITQGGRGKEERQVDVFGVEISGLEL